MRYRDPGEGKPKILWITRNEEGKATTGTNINLSLFKLLEEWHRINEGVATKNGQTNS